MNTKIQKCNIFQTVFWPSFYNVYHNCSDNSISCKLNANYTFPWLLNFYEQIPDKITSFRIGDYSITFTIFGICDRIARIEILKILISITVR